MDKPGTTPIRLNRYIAECGIASRRKADELIEQGFVQVNGKKVFELGIRVDPFKDKVMVHGKPIRVEELKYYVMFFKPRNVVTTLHDPEGRPCIADYFEEFPARLFPVGRLDWETEGLLLMTNDGDFANNVTHPTKEVTKTYFVKVDGNPTEEELKKLERGISIIGGKATAKRAEKLRRGTGENGWVKLVLAEGKNREIRRMFEKLGYDVLKLQRVAIGKLTLGSLERGEFVILNRDEVRQIFQPDTGYDEKPKRKVSPKRVTSVKKVFADR